MVLTKEQTQPGRGPDDGLDIERAIFPDGIEVWCQDKVLIALKEQADAHDIAIIGIDELAIAAQLPLEVTKAAAEELTKSRAVEWFNSNGTDVWVLAAAEDDTTGRSRGPGCTAVPYQTPTPTDKRQTG